MSNATATTFLSAKYDSIQIPLPVESQIRNIGGRESVQYISPGNIEFKGGRFSTKDEKVKEFIRGIQLFKAGVIIEVPAGIIKPESKKGSPVVGALSQQNIVDPTVTTTPNVGSKQVKASDRNTMVAYLVSEMKTKPEDLKGKKLPEVVKLAKDVYGIEFV